MANVKAPVRVYKSFTKVGRQVHFIATGEGNPRNGEGSFLRLENGGLLYAFSRYVGGDYHDDCRADIAVITSNDEGETWSEVRTVLSCPAYAQNLMSVSFLRMKNGDVGLFFIQKYEQKGTVCFRIMLSRSQDEGRSFGEPRTVVDEHDRRGLCNDRVLRLQNGDILLALSHRTPSATDSRGYVSFWRSSNDGESFCRVGKELTSPFEEDTTGFQEPGVFQYEDGRIWAWFRTRLGCQYRAVSTDNGDTWSDPVPDFRFTSPRAPMLVKRVGKHVVAVFNPVAEGAYTAPPFGMDRTPLMLSVSDDGGETFARSYLLEDDPNNAYCYPAVTECESGVLVAYYHSNGTGQFLNCNKIVKISLDEISK